MLIIRITSKFSGDKCFILSYADIVVVGLADSASMAKKNVFRGKFEDM